MPAGQPKGKSPEKFGKSAKDEKQEQLSSSEQQQQPESQAAKAAEAKQQVVDQVDEGLLEELQESKKIPYARFKEVNEKAKTLEQQLKDLSTKTQTDIQRAVEDAELRTWQRFQRQQEEQAELNALDPFDRQTKEVKTEIATLQSELGKLKAQNAEAKLSNTIDRLKVAYPEADELAVLGWAKVSPNADIEQLMAKSHQSNVERVEAKYKAYLEQKKQRAKSVLPTTEGGIRLNPTERPKTLKEAREMVKKLQVGH